MKRGPEPGRGSLTERTGAGRAIGARAAALLIAACAAAATSSCVHEMSPARTAPGTSPSSAELWTPPTGPVPAAAPGTERGTEAVPAIPPDLLAAAEHWTLFDLIDLALRTSPQTRVTWAQARSAAADLGGREGAWYPSIAGQVSTSAVRGSVAGGQFAFQARSANPFVALNWLLLDFGGRRAAIDSARQALIAADWTHNARIQDVVLDVQRAYYEYLNARALEQAEATSLKEAEASLDAAETRRAAGLATIADVLQAKTRRSEARLALETVEGQIQTIHGGLATALGLPANTHFDVAIPPEKPPAEQAAVEVERAIEEALSLRPDLAAARAEVERARAELRAREAADRPTLNTAVTSGRIWYGPSGLHQDTYNASFLLTIPIFNGLTYHYNLFKAQADRDAAQARLDTLERQVTLEVWTSYYNHKTASQRVETAGDLIESAEQSFEVVSARYRAGAGSILDLLTAQSALEIARAQEALARTDWFLTLAQFAHDTGTLWPSRPAGGTEAPPAGGSR